MSEPLPRFATWRDKAFKRDRFDAVVKVGGSVVYGPHGAEIAAALAAAAGRARLLAFPGGGEPDNLFERLFADGLLSSPTLDAVTALALDQTGHLLAGLVDGAELVRDVADASDVVRRGHLPVLAPARLLRTVDVFRATDRVSSDSMAAFLARLVEAPRVVLVKSRLPGVQRLDHLHDDGLVDEVFPDLVRAAGLRVTVVAVGHGLDLEAALAAPGAGVGREWDAGD